MSSWRQSFISFLQRLLRVTSSENASTIEICEPNERELLVNVRSLRQLIAQEIMIQRADVVMASVDASREDIMNLFKKHRLSFIPLYQENQDNILGGVSSKDFIAEPESRPEELLQPVLFISPSMRILDLLWQMRDTGQRYAIVVDEYGGMDGLVSFSDIVEEIIGDISATDQMTVAYDGAVIVDGRTRLDELEALFGVSFVSQDLEEDVDTLGGLVAALKGEVPTRGEHIRLSSGFDIEVVESDPRKITLLALRKF